MVYLRDAALCLRCHLLYWKSMPCNLARPFGVVGRPDIAHVWYVRLCTRYKVYNRKQRQESILSHGKREREKVITNSSTPVMQPRSKIKTSQMVLCWLCGLSVALSRFTYHLWRYDKHVLIYSNIVPYAPTVTVNVLDLMVLPDILYLIQVLNAFLCINYSY